jgi:hypothetical protein
MDWSKKSSHHSERICCQNWHFARTLGSRYWYSCISEDVCAMRSLRAYGRDGSSETWNLPGTFVALWEWCYPLGPPLTCDKSRYRATPCDTRTVKRRLRWIRRSKLERRPSWTSMCLEWRRRDCRKEVYSSLVVYGKINTEKGHSVTNIFTFH